MIKWSFPSSPPPDNGAAEAASAATVRWAELRPTHAGWYRCRATWLDAEYSSIGYYLNVMREYLLIHTTL